jgi:hypothetical protein
MSRSLRSVCSVRPNQHLDTRVSRDENFRGGSASLILNYFGLMDKSVVDDCNLQARSVSTDIRVIPTCASMHHGESQRVSITEFADDSRDKWLCHRYVDNVSM